MQRTERHALDMMQLEWDKAAKGRALGIMMALDAGCVAFPQQIPVGVSVPRWNAMIKAVVANGPPMGFEDVPDDWVTTRDGRDEGIILEAYPSGWLRILWADGSIGVSPPDELVTFSPDKFQTRKELKTT